MRICLKYVQTLLPSATLQQQLQSKFELVLFIVSLHRLIQLNNQVLSFKKTPKRVVYNVKHFKTCLSFSFTAEYHKMFSWAPRKRCLPEMLRV